jgi:hypothetical protein
MTLTVESWIEALESGKYGQATGHLRDDDGFCCLGVACDLADPKGWEPHTEFSFTHHDSASFLPDDVRLSVGLGHESGSFDFESLPRELRREICNYTQYGASALSTLNDRGVPFPLIAKVIRARPKGLFREEPQP